MGEILNPVSLGLHLLNLVVLYIAFKIWLYKPVAKFMQARAQRFADERLQLDEGHAEVARIKESSGQMAAQARAEAEQQVAEMMAQADKDAKSMLETAAKQADAILEAARKAAKEEQNRALDSMHDQVMDLSIALAGRILEREVSAADHQKLMEEFLSEVK